MHFEKGMSFRKISAFLNKSGIKTIRGCKWSVSEGSAHSFLKKKGLRDKRLSDRKEKFDYEIVDMSIQTLFCNWLSDTQHLVIYGSIGVC